MGTLGSYFRKAREARGLDLRDAAQQTRISINYLKAIEDENFSKLPGEVFVKGFLKNYARFLRLPEEEVVKLYGERNNPQQGAAHAAPKADVPQQRAVEARTAPEEQKQPGRLSLEPFLWGGIVLIGMALFIVLAFPARQPDHRQSGTVSTVPTATDSHLSAMTGTAKIEKLYLGIIALEDVWVLVRNDSSPQKKAVLKKGESVTWSADERFLLSYASVGALKITLNGNELTVNGPKNAVVRDLIVTAKGIAFQKVESDQPPKTRKPKPLTQVTTSVQPPAAQVLPVPPVETIVPPSPAAPAEVPLTPRE